MNPRRKSPTKGELEQLQKLYKTDEKIGERLGGVPAYLVAYWRRKKGIPRHSQPKFSDVEVRNLWERFGDDDRCGLELGISKAAFYNWRRKYGLRDKPPFLKLEQLELSFPGIKSYSKAALLYGKRTVTQKIIARAAGRDFVDAGEVVQFEPDLAITHNDTPLVIDAFKGDGAERVRNPEKLVIALSNPLSLAAAGSSRTGAAPQEIRAFALQAGIRHLYDVDHGACHQVVLEHGLLLPGQVAVSTDRNVASLGALAALAVSCATDTLADIWKFGRMSVSIPKTIRIDITGRRSRGICATDVALSIIRQLKNTDTKGWAIEYYGSAVSQMSISERATLAALTIETGATPVIIQYESSTRRFFTGRVDSEYTPVLADKDAIYEQIFQVNIDRLVPLVTSANRFDQIRSVDDLAGKPVSTIIIGAGSSGRFDDLRQAADLLRRRRVHEDCRLYIVPASHRIYLEALKKGLIRILVEAGAVIMNPGCPIHPQDLPGLLAANETCLVTGTRQRPEVAKGAVGEVLVCSPATAAASAVHAAVTSPLTVGE
jgi:3-isopropylmalate/(R)-2-methylmalate dehydratase large subunit